LKFLYKSLIVISIGIKKGLKSLPKPKKEVTWHIVKVVAVAVDTAEGHGRCTRRFAQIVRKNVKSLLNPEMTVRYTARIAIQSTRTKVVKRRAEELEYVATSARGLSIN
jgi:hypothetical protein